MKDTTNEKTRHRRWETGHSVIQILDVYTFEILHNCKNLVYRSTSIDYNA